MISHLLGTEDIESDLEELILEKTEGVPFFIEEFVKSLKDLKIVETKENKYHLAKDIQEVMIPSTIQDVIMARIDSLPEGAKRVLQMGAVVGRELGHDLIKTVTGLSERGLLSQISVLKDSELLYERGIYPQSTYIFKHALTQEVAYNSLLLKRKKEIHEKIGRTIEKLYLERLEELYEMLAYHYQQSNDREKGVEYLVLAAKKATEWFANQEALAFCDEALQTLDNLAATEENDKLRKEIEFLLLQLKAISDEVIPF
ncbi:MAG: hypothetical protein IME95_00870 [Proteobacteria bacterium]|nr:hypothetical protein [Pseudomonadota bacterium]